MRRGTVRYRCLLGFDSLDVPVRAAHQLAHAFLQAVLGSGRVLDGREDLFERRAIDDLAPDGLDKRALQL